MFPGSGRNTYSNSNYNYGPPSGPPPNGYNSPNGPPPSFGYGPPPGPPGRPPSGPPPGSYNNNYGQSSNGYPTGHNQGSYLSSSHLSMGGYQGQTGQGYSRDGYLRPSAPPPQSTNVEGVNIGGVSAPPPSTAPQSFGQNANMQFQYSNCTGKKKALLVGINYTGTSNALRGCINDVKNMSNFIVQYWGYKWEDIVILTDDQTANARRPTKDNIIRAMQWLVKDARPNDSLVFHYSGHGGVTKDLDGDEESGFDDVIYPLDFQTNGHIVDDDMHDIMVKQLPPGCRLTALYDSCHSGTALDLPYVYSTKGIVKEPNLLKDAGSGALNAFMAYERGNISGAISSIGNVIKRVTRDNDVDRNRVIQLKTSPADVISISGCKDDQTSADAKENGVSTGAMSWSFIQTLSAQPQQSYLSLLNNMRTLLSQKYSQKPQLSCSHPQDMNLQFLM